MIQCYDKNRSESIKERAGSPLTERQLLYVQTPAWLHNCITSIVKFLLCYEPESTEPDEQVSFIPEIHEALFPVARLKNIQEDVF